MSAPLLRAAAVGCVALALLGSPIAAQTELALVVPSGDVSLRAEKNMQFPRPLALELTVRSPTRARESRFPIVCASLLVETPRARRFANRGSVEFVVEVQRDGGTVERLDLVALPRLAGDGAVQARSCEGDALFAAPRLDVQVGDVVRLEARLNGIQSLKRGEEATLALGAASRAEPDTRARRGDESGSRETPGGEDLALVSATAGVDVPGSLTGPVSRGPRTASVGLVLPAALTNGRFCLSFSAFAGFGLSGGLEHPPTTVAAKVLVRRVDGGSKRVRLRIAVASGQLLGLACETKTRAYAAGDELVVSFRLNELVGNIPSFGNASIDVSLLAVAPQ